MGRAAFLACFPGPFVLALGRVHFSRPLDLWAQGVSPSSTRAGERLVCVSLSVEAVRTRSRNRPTVCIGC